MPDIPAIPLNDGATIPQLGFGVLHIAPDETAEIVHTALQAGCRHIDTAQMYGNEAGVGEGIRAAGVPRDEVFVTTKLSNAAHEPDAARRAFARSLEELGTDHVDLFLIHWPLPTRYGGDFVSTWKVLEELKADGRARSIGVSNFQVHHLERLAAGCDVVPAVNQIELHPYLRNGDLAAYGAQHGIVTEAWSPLAQGDVLGDPVITGIARRLGATPAQVVVRWHLELGHVVFPKSSTRGRIEENLASPAIGLEPDDVAAISALDRDEAGRRPGAHPDTFDYIP
jgi:2,5-diketo-D-gluconate reductase A